MVPIFFQLLDWICKNNPWVMIPTFYQSNLGWNFERTINFGISNSAGFHSFFCIHTILNESWGTNRHIYNLPKLLVQGKKGFLFMRAMIFYLCICRLAFAFIKRWLDKPVHPSSLKLWWTSHTHEGLSRLRQTPALAVCILQS